MSEPRSPRTFLICHEEERLNRYALPRWLGSFSTFTGVLVIKEPWRAKSRRAKRELRRVGFLRFLDVLAFRVWYKLFVNGRDRRWERGTFRELCVNYPEVDASVPVLETPNPNTRRCERFIRRCHPDIMIARSKYILKDRIFRIPLKGTFVMHPGICPEYRNAHGCFWALAGSDLDSVGMTLLRIDRGVDTGPVFGYYTCNYDEAKDSHIVIQEKTVFDNLERLADKLTALANGVAFPIDTTGRRSAAWGQPTLTAYLRWKRAAKGRAR